LKYTQNIYIYLFSTPLKNQNEKKACTRNHACLSACFDSTAAGRILVEFYGKLAHRKQTPKFLHFTFQQPVIKAWPNREIAFIQYNKESAAPNEFTVTVFWNMIPCNPVELYLCFEMDVLYGSSGSSILNMEAPNSSEPSITRYSVQKTYDPRFSGTSVKVYKYTASHPRIR
jgi:hypothetical protein